VNATNVLKMYDFSEKTIGVKNGKGEPAGCNFKISDERGALKASEEKTYQQDQRQ
jgi:hypothetical protein